jgi:hypothetical protein
MSSITDNNMDIFYKELGNSTSLVNQQVSVKLDDILGKKRIDLKYIPNFCKPGIHLGQRKLFLSELQYLTNIWHHLEKNKMNYLVYAGAAPATHTHFLAKFFPNIKFILVDPNKFDMQVGQYKSWEMLTLSEYQGFKMLHSKYSNIIESIPRSNWINIITKSDCRLFLIEDYFTDELAQMFAPLNPIFFSDIRTNETEDDKPTDLDLLWNSAMQFNWICIMRPRGYMLKFRTPFYDSKNIYVKERQRNTFQLASRNGIDFVSDFYKREFRYLSGDVFLQAFPPSGSTETRLCYFGSDIKTQYYNSADYENTLFYYNTISRGFVHRTNKYVDPSLYFDNCNDCALEALIWENYSKYIYKLDVRTCVRSLSDVLGRTLQKREHGYFFKPDVKYISEMVDYKYIDQKKIIYKKTPRYRAMLASDIVYSNKEIIENIMGRLPDQHKRLFEQYMQHAFMPTKLKANLSDINKRFPVVHNLRSFKPIVIGAYARSYFMSILRYVVESKCKILLVIGPIASEVPLRLLHQLCGIAIIYVSDKGPLFNYKENGNNIAPTIQYYKKPKDIKDYEEYRYLDGVGLLLNMVASDRYEGHTLVALFPYYYSIIQLVNPESYLMRFHPFVDTRLIRNTQNIEIEKKIAKSLGFDVDKHIKEDHIMFLSGEVWLVPFINEKALKGYLYGAHGWNNKLVKYDVAEFREKMMFYTQFDRLFYWHPNKYIHEADGYDCSLDAYIIESYCKNYNKNFSEIYNVIKRIFPVNFKTKGHGFLLEKNRDILSKMYNYENVGNILVRHFKHMSMTD